MLDSFESALFRRLFKWATVYYVLLFLASLLVQYIYDVHYPAQRLVFAFRSAALALNFGAFIWIQTSSISDKVFARVPPLLFLATAVLSICELAGSGGHPGVSAISWLIASMQYLFLFGFFVYRQWKTLLLGSFLLLLAVFLFLVFPDKLFVLELTSDQVNESLTIAMLFGLVIVTAIIYLGNSVYNRLLQRTRDLTGRFRMLAFIDQSTGLPNGLQLEQHLAEWDDNHKTVSSITASDKVSIVGFRLDGLEQLNEAMGVEKTNVVVGSIVREYMVELERIGETQPELLMDKPFERLYRVESNLFMFIARLDPYSFEQFIDRPILSPVIQRVVQEFNTHSRVSFQGGFGFYPDDAASLGELYRNVLNMLHRRRVENLGKFTMFDPVHYREYLRNEQLRHAFPDAIKNKEFRLLFQPKISVLNHSTVGFEALARWTSETLGAVPPAEFIPLAEQAGYIEELTSVLLLEALDFIRALKKAGYGTAHVSFNLSPGVLSPKYVNGLIDVIVRSGLARQLELEITEGILLRLEPVVLEMFNTLKRLGVRFSIDDFGTGYSNLGYLQSFEAEVLKIDKVFIDGIPGNEKNGKLVTAILHMGRSFGMEVVAEGVETTAQSDFLAEHGCDQIQGYLYSKPLEREEALKRIVGSILSTDNPLPS